MISVHNPIIIRIFAAEKKINNKVKVDILLAFEHLI